jgi:hypothetical protein
MAWFPQAKSVQNDVSSNIDLCHTFPGLPHKLSRLYLIEITMDKV